MPGWNRSSNFSTVPILNSTSIASDEKRPDSWLFLLHGIYGSGRNWGSLARRLVEERPEWGVLLVDLRLHGGSTEGFDPPHTVQACADDVARLEDHLGFSANALLGHSFGGKVALVRARGESALRQVWVADSTLRTGEPSGSAWRVIEIVRALPDTFESRDQVADALEREGYARGVGQWLAMNLERTDSGFRWKLDWDGVEAMLRDYFRTDVWRMIEDPPAGTEVHVIRATKSDAVDVEAQERIRQAGERTGRVSLHEVDAGHWLNVDNPDAVLDLLVAHLP